MIYKVQGARPPPLARPKNSSVHYRCETRGSGVIPKSTAFVRGEKRTKGVGIGMCYSVGLFNCIPQGKAQNSFQKRACINEGGRMERGRIMGAPTKRNG